MYNVVYIIYRLRSSTMVAGVLENFSNFELAREASIRLESDFRSEYIVDTSIIKVA
jgi:hypothetical protein